jgi:hypothetical protein
MATTPRHQSDDAVAVGAALRRDGPIVVRFGHAGVLTSSMQVAAKTPVGRLIALAHAECEVRAARRPVP